MGAASCDGNHDTTGEVPMSTTTPTSSGRSDGPLGRGPDAGSPSTAPASTSCAAATGAGRAATGSPPTASACCWSPTGAAVGLSLVGSDPRFTAGLGVTMILLEGIARVMKPALRAARARRASRKLDREFRLYDAQRATTASAAPRATRRSSPRSSGSWRRPTPPRSTTSPALPVSRPPAAKPADGESRFSRRRVPVLMTASWHFRRHEMRDSPSWVARRPPVRHTDRTNIR